jgi:geranylgeranyl pyrophosphate synthase
VSGAPWPASTDWSALLAAFEPYVSRTDDAQIPGAAPWFNALRAARAGGGKRVRPLLVFLVARAFRRDPAALHPLAAAVELVHAASLVQDDLPAQDNAATRRGRPTIHRAYGTATAELVSIALVADAFGELVKQWEWPKAKGSLAEAVTLLRATVGPLGMTLGQQLDLTDPRLRNVAPIAEGDEPRTDLVAPMEMIHRLKTGVLFATGAQLAARVSGASEPHAACVIHFARHLGLAYQVQDDLLDLRGDPAATGKAAGKDVGRATFPGVAGVAAAEQEVARLIDAGIAGLAPLGKDGDELVLLARTLIGRAA